MASAQELYQQGQQALAAGEQTRAYNLFIEAIEADEEFVEAWAALLPLADPETQADIREQIEALDPAHPSLDDDDEIADPRDLFLSEDEDDADDESLDMLRSRDVAEAPDIPVGAVIEDDVRDNFEDDTAPARDVGETLAEMQERVQRGIAGLPGGDRNVVPGISVRTAAIYGVGLLVFTFCMLSFSLSVIGSRNSAAMAEQTEVARLQTESIANQEEVAAQQATAIQRQTDDAFFLTRTVEIATQDARRSIAEVTVPPTNTPTETPTQTSFRVAPLPPEGVGLSGQLVVWGGNNPINDGFFQALTFDPTDPDPTRRFTDFVQDLTVSRDGSSFVYRSTNSIGDVSLFQVPTRPNAQERSLGPLVRSIGVVDERLPSVDLTGDTVMLISENINLPNTVVYLVNTNETDIQFGGADEVVTQVTSDDGNYSSVAISPDATTAVAVKRSAGGTDIVLIDLTDPAFPQTPLTQDGDILLEAWPHFSADGRQIVYSAAPNTAPDDHDLYVMGINLPNSGNIFVEEAGDQIYPVFSPDSRFVAYASNEVADQYNLFIYDLITMTKYQLTESDRNPFFPGAWVESIQ